MGIFLDCLDQFRYITGLLGMVVLLCHGILPHRERYAFRVALGYLISLMAALAFVPMKMVFGGPMAANPILSAPYWLAMSFVPVGYVLLCYETNLAGALFRTLMAAFVENFTTIIIRYLLVLRLFPLLPRTHPVGYILIALLIYGVLYTATWFLLRKKLSTDESEKYPDLKETAHRYLLTYVAYTAILSSAKAVCEYLILPLGSQAEYLQMYHYLQNFLIVAMLLISVVMTIILYSAYSLAALQNENQIITQMVRERQSQYEFSKENIDMINRKAHDLKHQLKALEQISDEERRKQLRETRKAIDFYDAVVKTGNEALDTLLTEKSVFCRNRDIRLSCTVSSQSLDKIGLVDLYTLLGNAIDNAIEGVEGVADPEKKVVSLTIRDQGQMLFIHIENYYDGTIQMDRGAPLTRKADKENHGYGVKSIRSIARKYGGEVLIQTEGQIFSLEILIPT